MVQDSLRIAINFTKTGKKAEARRILAKLLKEDPKNESAWLWLAACMDSSEQKAFCLSKALEINPSNQNAAEAIKRLKQPEQQEIEQPSLEDLSLSHNISGSLETQFATSQQVSVEPQIVTLACPSCGGKLQITEDIERFACTHCGNEHLVKRAGGVVSIAPVVGELKKISSSVDDTANELVIRRLRDDIADLEKENIKSIRKVVTNSFQSITLALQVIGKVSFLQNIKMKPESDTEKVMSIIDDLSLSETHSLVNEYESKIILKTKGATDNINTLRSILQGKSLIQQKQSEIQSRRQGEDLRELSQKENSVPQAEKKHVRTNRLHVVASIGVIVMACGIFINLVIFPGKDWPLVILCFGALITIVGVIIGVLKKKPNQERS